MTRRLKKNTTPTSVPPIRRAPHSQKTRVQKTDEYPRDPNQRISI